MRPIVIIAAIALIGCQKAEAGKPVIVPSTDAIREVIQQLREGDTTVCGNDHAKRMTLSLVAEDAFATARIRYLELVERGKKIAVQGAYATNVRKELGEVSCRAKITLNDHVYAIEYTLRPSADNPNDYIIDAVVHGFDKLEFSNALKAEVARQVPDLS